MMWVAFISLFVLLVSSAAADPVHQEHHDAGPSDTIGHNYAELHEEDFKGVTLVAIVHFVTNITFEDMEGMVNDITAVGKKCAADEHAGPECAKSYHAHIMEEVCHDQHVAERYGYAECCAKVDKERNECLMSHRNATEGPVSPVQHPSAEEGCKAFHDNRLMVLGHFLYKIARKYLEASATTLLSATDKYEKVLETCCQHEDKDACFAEKASAVKKQTKQAVMMEKQNCFLLKKFGPKTLHTLKLAHLAQKFPKAACSVLHNISHDIVHVHEERCRGDTLESYLDQVHVTKFVCSHQDIISPKVKTCCDVPLLHRAECFVNMENDEPPADLSPTVREFVDNKEVCQHFADHPDHHLERFLYEYARRHPEFSPQLIMRLQEGYRDLLKKCCLLDAPEACLAEGEALLKKHVAATLEVIHTNCDLYAKLGDDTFKGLLLFRYTKKAPQLSFEELNQYADHLTGVAHKCCPLSEDKRLVCAEGAADFVLGNVCLRHQKDPINPHVCQCCSKNYAFRRECFSNIEGDDGYAPPPCAPELFTFHEDLCTASAEAKEKKHRMLVDMVKCKPTITFDQMKNVTKTFYGTVEKCCKAENHEACVIVEGPKMEHQALTALH